MLTALDKPPSAAPSAGVGSLLKTYKACETTRDYIDLGLDCADEVLRMPRAVLGWVRLDGWVPRLGKSQAQPSLEKMRLGMMDQVQQLEATLVDCETQLIAFERFEASLLEEAVLCQKQGDHPSLKRIWEEVRTCRERQGLQEARRQKVRAWQQELWREAHALLDVEHEHKTLTALEQLNTDADVRRARAARLTGALAQAQLGREERAVDALEEEDPQEFAAFCASLAGASAASAQALPTKSIVAVRAASEPVTA